MMAVITYDVSEKQSAVKTEMRRLGYSDSWALNGQIYNLPNTTLWKKDCDPATALSDITRATNGLRVTLQRAVAVELGSWKAITGDPHS